MPYAYGATIKHEYDTDHLHIWLTFHHQMLRSFDYSADPVVYDVFPPLAKWLIKADTVAVDTVNQEWIDEFTLLITSDTIASEPVSVTVEYDGPDEGLCFRWGKQIEPWGPTASDLITGDSRPYGDCYGKDLTWVQANAVQNTWYNIADADMFSSQLNRVTHDGSGKLTVLVSGKYLITYGVTITCSIANKHIETGIEKNSSGTAEDSGQSHYENGVAGEEEVATGTCILNLTANDTIEVCIRTTDAGTPNLAIQSLNITCTKINDIIVDPTATIFLPGMIILWSGSVATIPSGWTLCNGSNGTPDLRNRFVVGAGSTYNPGNTGGAITHQHGVSGTSGSADNAQEVQSGIGKNVASENHTHEIDLTTDETNHLPPYYALCYIMKL